MNLTGDRCQCPSCNEYFNSTSAFDKHRVGDFPGYQSDKRPNKYGNIRRCMVEGEMLEAGMMKNKAGFWIGKPFLCPPVSTN